MPRKSAILGHSTCKAQAAQQVPHREEVGSPPRLPRSRRGGAGRHKLRAVPAVVIVVARGRAGLARPASPLGRRRGGGGPVGLLQLLDLPLHRGGGGRKAVADLPQVRLLHTRNSPGTGVPRFRRATNFICKVLDISRSFGGKGFGNISRAPKVCDLERRATYSLS